MVDLAIFVIKKFYSKSLKVVFTCMYVYMQVYNIITNEGEGERERELIYNLKYLLSWDEIPAIKNCIHI